VCVDVAVTLVSVALIWSGLRPRDERRAVVVAAPVRQAERVS